MHVLAIQLIGPHAHAHSGGGPSRVEEGCRGLSWGSHANVCTLAWAFSCATDAASIAACCCSLCSSTACLSSCCWYAAVDNCCSFCKSININKFGGCQSVHLRVPSLLYCNAAHDHPCTHHNTSNDLSTGCTVYIACVKTGANKPLSVDPLN